MARLIALQIAIPPRQRELLGCVLGRCGSLAPGGPYWDAGPERDLFRALGDEDIAAADAAATALVEAAVPEEGDPHPRRATVAARDGAVYLTSPAGVVIELTPFIAEQGVILRVDFGRASRRLATEMLCALVLAGDAGLELEAEFESAQTTAGEALARLLTPEPKD